MHKSKQEVRSVEQRKLSIGMKRLLTGFRSLLEAALEKEGVTLAQLRMLHALDARADTSAAELARTCYITPQSMQAVVTKAEREGWITRTASPANRRVLTATLTRPGRKVLERGMALSAGIEQVIWAGAKASELRAVNQMLQAAVDRLQESLDARHAEQQGAPRRKNSLV